MKYSRNNMRRRRCRALTAHEQPDALDEDPSSCGPLSVHHHEAVVAPRVSKLNVADDQGTIPRPQLLLGHPHPALKLRRLPLLVPALFEHRVGRGHPLDVADGQSRLTQVGLPAAGKDRLVPRHVGDGQHGGGKRRGVCRKKHGKNILVNTDVGLTSSDLRVTLILTN